MKKFGMAQTATATTFASSTGNPASPTSAVPSRTLTPAVCTDSPGASGIFTDRAARCGHRFAWPGVDRVDAWDDHRTERSHGIRHRRNIVGGSEIGEFHHPEHRIAAAQEWQAREAAGETSYAPAGDVRRRLGNITG